LWSESVAVLHVLVALSTLWARMTHSAPILVVDVGGSYAKAKVDDGDRIQVPTGPDARPQPVVEELQRRIAKDSYDVVTIGVPTPVVDGRLTANPKNLGPGWADFDFVGAFGCPVRLINDAALQAIGGYRGGRMLFLGFGTGLGSALIVDDLVVPLELAHLPYRDGMTYEQEVGDAAQERLGLDQWERRVHVVTGLLRAGLVADEVLIGGGNVRQLRELPRAARRGGNRHAFAGGQRLWREDAYSRQFPEQKPLDDPTCAEPG